MTIGWIKGKNLRDLYKLCYDTIAKAKPNNKKLEIRDQDAKIFKPHSSGVFYVGDGCFD